MQRPIRIDRIVQPGLGVLTVEGTDPASLIVLADRVFGLMAASAQSFPYVSGMSLSGGGDGASWRVVFFSGEILGPGVQQSIFAARCHCWFTRAKGVAEINSQTARLMADIQVAHANAFVYDVQVAGGGRDGEYMIAVLFGENAASPPVLAQFDAATGPFAVATDIVSITIPQTVSGTANDQASYAIHWSVAVNDPAGVNGFTAQLFNVTTTTGLEIYDDITAATDWACQAGVFIMDQPVGADHVISIRVTPAAANANTRDAQIAAFMVNRTNEPS